MVSSVASAETSEPITRPGRLLVWFGGGHWRDLADRDERATYQLAGFVRRRGQDAEAALAAAERDLALVRAARNQDAPVLDRDIAELRGQLAADRQRAIALARADSGIDARWEAMHGYTTVDPVAFVLRLGVLTFFVALSLLPLLLRLWRGQTEQDRRILARRERLRAEEEADTALAIAQAEARAEAVAAHAALPPAERAVALAALAERPDTERPVLTATASRAGEWAAPVVLEAGGDAATPTALEPQTSVLGELARRTPGPLDNLPGPLPSLARAVTGLIPEQITQLPAQVATNPVKTARTLLEDVEELQVTFTRKRTVTVHEEDTAAALEPDAATPVLERGRRRELPRGD
ncbi:MAG: DUF4407 domain-containing protein [Actinophytocola sp.]|nr:DUF4407 domain-containing protein [Actinophytocola sp.]